MTSWQAITSAPGFATQVAAVLAHLVEEQAATADDEQAYRSFAVKALASTAVPNLQLTPHDDGTVSVWGPAINDRIMPWSSFVAGAPIVAVPTLDLEQLPATNEPARPS